MKALGFLMKSRRLYSFFMVEIGNFERVQYQVVVRCRIHYLKFPIPPFIFFPKMSHSFKSWRRLSLKRRRFPFSLSLCVPPSQLHREHDFGIFTMVFAGLHKLSEQHPISFFLQIAYIKTPHVLGL